MNTKYCPLCERELSVGLFSVRRRAPDGLYEYCKNCKSKKDKEYQIKNKDKIKIKQHEKYVENAEKIKDRVVEYRNANPDKVLVWAKRSREVIKTEIMSHYCSGEIKCFQCPENDINLLTIDHIDGGGNKHRDESGCGRGSNICFWLKRNNFPEGFQILCWNCNWKKRLQEMQPDGVLSIRQQQKKDYVRSVKEDVVNHYGQVCLCGESDLDLLTLDHVNDDGAKHKKELGKDGINFYLHLRKNNFPNDPPLQVLCIKCQYRKRNGILIPVKIDLQKKIDLVE